MKQRQQKTNELRSLRLTAIAVATGLSLGCSGRSTRKAADSGQTPIRAKAQAKTPPPKLAPAPPPAAATQKIATVLGLTQAQRSRLEAQGLVVTQSPERFGSVPSRIYDEIYQQDLPVLITSDSILYAFHRNYISFLPQLETSQLMPLLKRVLHGARNRLVRAVKNKEWGPDKAKLAQDLDLYLSVPLRLLGTPKKPALASSPRAWLVDTISKIYLHEAAPLDLLGTKHASFDFSRFKVRGHYTKTDELERYFRAMVWLSQVPITVAAPERGQLKVQHRGFEQAAALSWLLQESGELEAYNALVHVLDALVGPGDDESPADLQAILKKHDVCTVSQFDKLSEQQKLTWLNTTAHQHGRIRNTKHVNNTGLAKAPQARNFMLLGQRYILDSEVFQNLVYDRLTHPSNPKVAALRKLPKSLDIIAALGNPRAKVHLKDEFERYPYEHALDQERARIAKLPPEFWKQNVHSAWLAAIASLHEKQDDPRLAPVFRSDAWKDKTIQTQLGSWAELRHDHLLYGKQPVSGSIGCEFPDAYVEPVPHVYAKIKVLVSKLHAVIDELKKVGMQFEAPVHDQLVHFSAVLDRLYTIADKELRRAPLSPQEKHFLKQAVEMESVGYGKLRWDGWYPRLTGVHPNVGFEPTIVDVHVDPPDESNGFKQRVLHAGTGAFEVASVIVQCGEKTSCAYVGPVYSFYEKISPTRLHDQEWLREVWQHPLKNRPSWTQSFVVPGNVQRKR